MNTSKNYYVKQDRTAEAIYPAAEFAHKMWEQHLDEQSQLFMDCYNETYLDGETLLCMCPVCNPKPEPGCYCELCMLRRNVK